MPWAVAAGVAGAAITSYGARSAAGDQSDAANRAADLQWQQYMQSRDDQAPWRQAGVGALNELMSGLGVRNQSTFDEQAYLAQRPDAVAWLEAKRAEGQPMTAWDHYVADGSRESGMFRGAESSPGFGDFNRDFTMADFQQDPGMQFRMQQGQRALEASAAARGGLLSGGTGKDLVEYGQNFGSQEYGNAYNRFNADRDRRFNRLSSIAGIGQTATRDVNQLGANAATNAGSFGTQAANARAAGTVAQGNAFNSALGTVGNWYQQQNQPQQQAGGSWGSSGMNNFFFGSGTSGD